MFTGIIEELGRVEDIFINSQAYRLKIRARKVLEGTRIGDSIATNGVCLTVTGIEDSCFFADVMKESISRSNLGELRVGSKVNLERALRLDSRLGGHIVTGHIDGVGKIVSKVRDGNAVWLSLEAGEDILSYIVFKGSVALDGISLTVASVEDKTFKVSIIPHTEKETSLEGKEVGDRINIECDILGKYVEKLLKVKKPNKASDISMDFLGENGFL